MTLPADIRLYSVPASNADGTTHMSLRFALTKEEFEFAVTNGIIPEDTTEIDMIGEIPAIHDLHLPSTSLQ